ncbi:DUF378 domain-containing protein [Patescibacteria group bacterium]|nr:DUF378 domain-containing protein [Patescibacteria group bacterium]MBU1705542.1 DUF378 domain-containing protein [Patescibacteria group bacterium]
MKISFWLLIVGGLNWGLIGLFHFNLVAKIFGSVSWIEDLIYILVGVAAVVKIFKMKHCCSNGK